MTKSGLLSKLILGSALGLGSLVNTGCETIPSDPQSAQYQQNANDAAALSLLFGLAGLSPRATPNQAATLNMMSGVTANYSNQQAAMAAAREGRTQVNVNVGEQTQHYQQQRQTIEFITFSAWRDINNNGTIDREEFFGEDKTVYSLSKDIFQAALFNQSDCSGVVIFKSWTSDGELVGETIVRYEPFKLVTRWTGVDSNPTGELDYLDKIKQRGPGKYRLTATIEIPKGYKIIASRGDGAVKSFDDSSSQFQTLVKDLTFTE